MFTLSIDDENMRVVVAGDQESELRRVSPLSTHCAYELTALAAGLRAVSDPNLARPIFDGLRLKNDDRVVVLWPALKFQVGRPRLVGKDVGITIYCCTNRSRVKPKRVILEFIDGNSALKGEVDPAVVLEFSAELGKLAEAVSIRVDKVSASQL